MQSEPMTVQEAIALIDAPPQPEDGDVLKFSAGKRYAAAWTVILAHARATTAGTGAEQMGERCYPDDHGQYAHECGICRAPFTGGKGRVVCRVCEPTGEELRRLRLTYEPERMGALVTAALAASARGA